MSFKNMLVIAIVLYLNRVYYVSKYVSKHYKYAYLSTGFMAYIGTKIATPFKE